MFGLILLMGAATILAAFVPTNAYAATSINPSPVTCSITFASSGGWSATDGGALSGGIWKTGGGTGADYWIRWTTTDGALSSGAAGVWQSLAGNQTWTRTHSAIGASSVTGTVEIATDAAGATVVATGSITLWAEVL